MVSINDDPPPVYPDEDEDNIGPIKKISATSGYAYAVNYVLGMGILGIPYAIVQGGLVLSIIVLIVVALLSLLSAFWIVEATARANAVINLANRDLDTTELDPLVKKYNNPFKLGNRRFEIVDLCKIFLPSWSRYLYALVSVIYIWSILWSYGNVFGTSLTSLIPFPGVSAGESCDFFTGKFGQPCINAYYIYMAFFIIAVIPLCLLDLSDQILCFFRFVAITMMFATAVGSLYTNPYDPDNDNDPPYVSYSTLFRFEGFSTLFPIAVFSQLLHYAVPGILHPLERKSRIRRVFFLSSSTTLAIYITTGVACAMYFGSNTRALITLNWKHPAGFSPADAPLWAKVLSYFVFLFPVVDMISSFPLSAVALSDMLFAMIHPRLRTQPYRTRTKVLCRLGVALPPLIAATFVRSLFCSPVFNFLNTAGFFIAFITPAVLQIRSKAVCAEKFGPRLGTSTPYSWHGSHNVYAALVLMFGIGAFVYVNVENVLQLFGSVAPNAACRVITSHAPSAVSIPM